MHFGAGIYIRIEILFLIKPIVYGRWGDLLPISLSTSGSEYLKLIPIVASNSRQS
jgi:hypothetical protein